MDCDAFPSEWQFSWKYKSAEEEKELSARVFRKDIAVMYEEYRARFQNTEEDYQSEEKASIVYSALAVDKELQPDKVKRQMSISNGKLSVHFQAVEARFLRASYSAFVDVLTLATRTIEEFGPGTEL